MNRAWILPFLAFDAVVMVLLVFPLANLLAEPTPQAQALFRNVQDPKLAKVAPIFMNKCADCHTSLGQMPFYSQFPIAKETINADIVGARARWDIELMLQYGPTPTNLERLEEVMKSGEMPPAKYTVLHWNTPLTEADKAAILRWIEETRQQQAAKSG